MKVARELNRHSIGFERLRDLEDTIKKKTGFDNNKTDDIFEIQERKTGKYRFINANFAEEIKKRNSKNKT